MILQTPQFIITRNDPQYINGEVVWFKLPNGNPWYDITVQHERRTLRHPTKPADVAHTNFPCLGSQPPATMDAFIKALQLANAIAKKLPKYVPLAAEDEPDPADKRLWGCPTSFWEKEPVSTWKMLRLLNVRFWNSGPKTRADIHRRLALIPVGESYCIRFESFSALTPAIQTAFKFNRIQ